MTLSSDTSLRRLHLRAAGMFSNVNEVVHQLYLSEQQGYRFVIDWSNSSYKTPDLHGDPWGYYFEDCFNDLPADTDLYRAEPLPSVFDQDNIITPFSNGVMQAPANRQAAHRIIKTYIRPKPHITSRVDAFVAEHFTDYTIGAHIRGPLRTDAGGRMRSRLKLKNGVPFETYFEPIHQKLTARPEARILICSDSEMVIDETRHEFGDRVITYEATRSDKGEMHLDKSMGFDPYKLGEDVIIECLLLARTNFFVHGYSNIANFILCKSLSQEACYPYAEADPSMPDVYSRAGLEYRTRVAWLKLKHKIRRRLHG